MVTKHPLRSLLLAGLLAITAASVKAQGQNLMDVVRQVKDLELPGEPSSLGWLTPVRMALFKPDGTGPFPAVVLLHQCAGLSTHKKNPNRSMLDWTRRSVARGYVVLLLDSLDQRGAETLCGGPQRGVNFPRGVRDAMLAAEHLRRLDYVDGKRVMLVGFSWGAGVAAMASSARYGEQLKAGERFTAAVGFYPPCFTLRPPNGTPYETLNADIDRPFLALLGGEDTETPATMCVQKLEAAKTNGAPVEWQVYPAATHCWDCQQLHGVSKVDSRGSHVQYRYDADLTESAANRLFDYLDRQGRR